MSDILWKAALHPPADGPVECRVYELWGCDTKIPRVACFHQDLEELVRLPEPRHYQVLNRSGLLMIAAAMQGSAELQPYLLDDPYSVGIYCATQKGPKGEESARKMAWVTDDRFASAYKAARTSKTFFKEITNIPPSQLGIAMGIMGPQKVFSHSRWACLHALEQAEMDLQNGIVQAALVCSGFSLEEYLLALRIRRDLAPECLLSEGAAALVLTRGNTMTDWQEELPDSTDVFFGTANDLVHIARRGKDKACTASPAPVQTSGLSSSRSCHG